MIKINFYPESDKARFIEGAKEYQKIWDADGKRIVEVLERLTRLRFAEHEINAVTFRGISHSYPLRLRAEHPSRKSVLVHELSHRLLAGNKFIQPNDVGSHRLINLVLYEAWTELYGEDFAKESVALEYTYHSPIYKESWEWALSFSKEQRAEKFWESLKNPEVLIT